jgi:hypothetical protein
MSDTYEINERNEVVTYTAGRRCNDTRSWRDATEMELQQRESIVQLERELAEETTHHETLEGMYHKVVSACLRCDPIPACEREDDELEPPWEVIDRVKRQRDTLADALNGIIVDCSYDLPSWRVEESKEALAAVKGEEPEDPHKYCRGGGGNNFHCGCKYDAQNHESFYP